MCMSGSAAVTWQESLRSSTTFDKKHKAWVGFCWFFLVCQGQWRSRWLKIPLSARDGPENVGMMTLVHGNACTVQQYRHTHRELETYARIECVQMINEYAWLHACRRAHNQCSHTAGLTSGGAWPDRWPMSVSTSASACLWVCMCMRLSEWKSAGHPCEHSVFQFTSLEGYCAPVHNGAAASAQF